MAKKKIHQSDLLVQFLTRQVNLKFDKNDKKYVINHSESLLSPSLSNWYNPGKQHIKLDTSCDVVFSLGSGKEVLICNTKFVDTEKSNFYFKISRYADNYDQNRYINHNEMQEQFFDKFEHYGFEMFSGNMLRIVVGKEKNSVVGYRTLVSIQDAFKERYTYLQDLANKLNNQEYPDFTKDYKTSENVYIQKNEVRWTHFDKDRTKHISKLLTQLRKKAPKLKDGFDLIKFLGDYFLVSTCNQKNHTIDNGWGSYTYTYIWKSISLTNDMLTYDECYYILYYAEYILGIKLGTQDHYLNYNPRNLGMIQCRGGYTHVS